MLYPESAFEALDFLKWVESVGGTKGFLDIKGIYFQNGDYDTTGNGIDKCKSYCSDDHSCGAFEWTLHYCSWWRYGKCQNKSDATMSNTKYMTCRKGMPKLHNLPFFPFPRIQF